MVYSLPLTESQIQKSIMQYLYANKILCFRINTKGEFRQIGPGKGILTKNPNKGFSDLICILDGRAIFLEVKTKSGKISKDQMLFANRVFKAQAHYYIVRSIEDVKSIFESLGVKL